MSTKGLRGVMFLIGEVLFITRPLIYVLFIRKYGIRSWTPWFLSLAIDCIGTSILSLVTTSAAGRRDHMFHLSASEKDEVRVSLELHNVDMQGILGLSVFILLHESALEVSYVPVILVKKSVDADLTKII